MFVPELGYDVKSTSLEFKDIDSKQGIVVGYFSAFGVKDWDGDILVKGAFKKSIEERGPKSTKTVNFKIKHLLDHNKKNAVAVIQELSEDDFGLRYESKAGRHAQGQDWLKMCEDGIITEHSTGTIPVKNKVLKKSDGNHITETFLIEGSSLQAWGANPGTPIVGFKEIDAARAAEYATLLEKAIRNGTYTDETFEHLINKLTDIKELLKQQENDTIEPGPTQHTTQPGSIAEKSNKLDLQQLFTFKN